MVKTIREVFINNLYRLQCGRSTANMARLADIPYMSWRNAEEGKIPQSDNLAAIARAFGIPETALFLDESLLPAVELERAIEMLRTHLERAPLEAPAILRKLFPSPK